MSLAYLITFSLLSLTFKPLPAQKTENLAFEPMASTLWQYLRKGLNYLETSGKEYPPDFKHPGGKAFGALGLSQAAALDVMEKYPSLAKFSLQEVFTKQAIYEAFAKNYADLLLRHYLGIDYSNMPAQEVFYILQKAWFLGPNLYKKGEQVLLSREKRAKEYLLASQSF